MNVEQFMRKEFPVDAVRVTEENFEDVAKWCDGEIHKDTTESELSDNPTNWPFHIKVRVHNPLNERQTRAYVGDWVLYAGKGYKVYTDKAFKKSFISKPLEQSVFDSFDTQRNLSVYDGVTLGQSSGSNPGGTTSVG